MTELMKKKQVVLLVVLSLVAVGAGIGAGYLGSTMVTAGEKNDTLEVVKLEDGGTVAIAQVATSVESIKNGDVFGSADEKVFKDSAQGFLAEGGIDDEGSHHLQRPGGKSQTVYLTSSVTDLDMFIGMEVKVWGETNRGRKAGWLMDVGRVQIINVSGTEPTE